MGSFNSRSLGFFLASASMCKLPVFPEIQLSIPVPWDFSLHHASLEALVPDAGRCVDFQFPFLGIFPCISLLLLLSLGFLSLSIPVPWDFSLHHRPEEGAWLFHGHNFQFPFLGIFPCIIHVCYRSNHNFSLSIPVPWDFSLHPPMLRLSMLPT